MDKKTVIEYVKKMATARTCCPELKRKVQRYLIALGKPGEKIAAADLIAEIEEDVVPIDELLTFARSARAIQILGKDEAKKLLAHVGKIHSEGAKYCDCGACTYALKVLENKDILLTEEETEEKSVDRQILFEKLRKIEASPSCCDELEEAIQKYFNALGTAKEKIVAEELVDELKADVVPIEVLVINAHANRAIEYFGVEGAKKFAAHADALKASGAKYCNCLACTVALEVLEHKDVLLNLKKPTADVVDKETQFGKLRKIELSPSCYADLKEAIKNYFNALGTAQEKVAAQNLIDELKEDVVPIDELVAFAHSAHAAEIFGADGAKKVAEHADELKASGAKWCNCLACTLGLEVLEHKDVLLK